MCGHDHTKQYIIKDEPTYYCLLKLEVSIYYITNLKNIFKTVN